MHEILTRTHTDTHNTQRTLTGMEDIPGLNTLRLMRAFRVLRLFGRLSSLRQIINALTAAILPVLNAFLIMLLVISIYAILAVSFYGELRPKLFGSFTRALFTMFQVCCHSMSWVMRIMCCLLLVLRALYTAFRFISTLRSGLSVPSHRCVLSCKCACVCVGVLAYVCMCTCGAGFVCARAVA